MGPQRVCPTSLRMLCTWCAIDMMVPLLTSMSHCGPDAHAEELPSDCPSSLHHCAVIVTLWHLWCACDNCHSGSLWQVRLCYCCSRA